MSQNLKNIRRDIDVYVTDVVYNTAIGMIRLCGDWITSQPHLVEASDAIFAVEGEFAPLFQEGL